jgi:hypothetical protein
VVAVNAVATTLYLSLSEHVRTKSARHEVGVATQHAAVLLAQALVAQRAAAVFSVQP